MHRFIFVNDVPVGLVPVGTPGFKMKIGPQYSQRRLNGAVSRNNNKKGGPVSVLGRAC